MGSSSSWATPFIITRDSARWIGPILAFYRECGLDPTVLLDAASTDGTAAVLEALGTPYTVVEGEAPRVEALVERIAQVQPDGWVLRMDDDEAPSRGLVAFLAGAPPSDDLAAVALARRHLWRDEAGRMSRGRWTHPFFGEALEHDWQWRLFQPDRVTYTHEIHTPGFVVPPGAERAPPHAWIAHLDWIVRSPGERRAKVEGYDRQKPGAGSFLRTMYLPEEADSGVVLDPLGPSEFEGMAARLMEARA